MYDSWAKASDFTPGEPVHYVLARLPGIMGKVVAVHPKIEKVDVLWPSGEKRMDPWDIVPTVAFQMAMLASEKVRPIVASASKMPLSLESVATLQAKHPSTPVGLIEPVVAALMKRAEIASVDLVKEGDTYYLETKDGQVGQQPDAAGMVQLLRNLGAKSKGRSWTPEQMVDEVGNLSSLRITILVDPLKLKKISSKQVVAADWNAVKDSLSRTASKFGYSVPATIAQHKDRASFKVTGAIGDATFVATLLLDEKETGLYTGKLLNIATTPDMGVEASTFQDLFKNLEGSASDIMDQFGVGLKKQSRLQKPVSAEVKVDEKEYKQQVKHSPHGKAQWVFQTEKGETRTVEDDYDEAKKQVQQFAEGRKERKVKLVPTPSKTNKPLGKM